MELKVDGHFLYGAPASGLQLEGDMLVAPAAGAARALPVTSSASPTRKPPATSARRSRTCPRPTPTASRPFRSAWQSRRPRPGRRRPRSSSAWRKPAAAPSSAKLVLPVAPAAAMIGVKPLFGDKNVAEGDKAGFDVVFVAPDGKPLARDGLRYELLKIESRYQWYRQNSSWEYEPVKSTTRVADGDVTVAADKPSRITLSPQPGRYRLDVKSTEADGPLTSVQFDVGWYSDGSADTPGSSGNLDRQAGIPIRRHHGGVGQCAHGRQAHHQCAGRPPADDADHRRQGRHRAGQDSRRQGLGHRRLCGGDAAPSAGRRRAADAGAGDRAEMVRHRQEGPHADGRSFRRRRWFVPAQR